MPHAAWPDGRCRCRWANPANPLYIRYHDEEWGRPLRDDRGLFELLILESFQAGLSWECVLNKRASFRAAFDNFDPAVVARYDEAREQALLADAGIIRNRAKIHAAVGNARAFLAIRERYGSFAAWLWDWTGGEPIHERGRVTSPLAERVSNELRRRGMRFVGPVIVYSYLQAAGLIESHEAGCFLAEDAWRGRSRHPAVGRP